MIPAFAAYGIELEYMLVDCDRLDVAPIADEVLERSMSLERGELGWSNELVLHVLELKNPRPSAALGELAARFQHEVRGMNRALAPKGVRLMPSGMHPWMDPVREAKLWPHGNSAVYRAYDRIFDCRRHGWANVQAMHVNLPFANDEEFARLHAAVRLVLPILPAIAASSPFAEGKSAPALDYRMAVYCENAASIRELNGELIPQPVSSRDEYEREILAPLYRAIEPHDSEALLRHEWLNARGAIPRFDRNALEIRVLDMQECPAVDVALAAAVIDLVRSLYEEPRPHDIPTAELAAIFGTCVRDAERATITSPRYLASLGIEGQKCSAQALWQALLERAAGSGRALWEPTLTFVLRRGPLARRLLAAAGTQPSHEALAAVYAELCECLHDGRPFDP